MNLRWCVRCVGACLFVCALLSSGDLLGQPGPSPTPATKPLSYFIVVTGGEMLEGVYADAHTPFITRALRPLGCQCAGSLTVDDNRADIQQALRFATNRAPLVILTGGLGPTPNDITRETVADFLGIPLHEQVDVVTEMERRLNTPRAQMRPNLRRQALVPTRGSFLRNTQGTAVGLVFDAADSVIVALPGPPRELQPMVLSELVPLLRQKFGVREFGSSLTLRFVGAGQSLIDQTIKDHVTVTPDIVITSLFEGGRVDFTFSVPGHEQGDRDRLRRLEQSILEHLGEYIYADDGSTLEDVVARKLRDRGGSLVLVEMGTGGALAAALSSSKESATVLQGAFTSAEPKAMARLLKVQNEKCPDSPAEMARFFGNAAAEQTGCGWVIAVSPVVSSAGQGGKSLWVALRFPNGHWEDQRFGERDATDAARAMLTTQILDFVRRKVQDQR
jgi:nicotinamide-nucleotide amidase